MYDKTLWRCEGMNGQFYHYYCVYIGEVAPPEVSKLTFLLCQRPKTCSVNNTSYIYRTDIYVTLYHMRVRVNIYNALSRTIKPF